MVLQEFKREELQVQQLYPKINEVAEDIFELVFAIKMQKIVERASLDQVINNISSKLRVSLDTTKLIRETRDRNYGY